MSPGFPRCCYSLELSQISPPKSWHHHSLYPGDSEPSASSPTISCSPSADHPNSECASYFCTAVTLSPHPSQHMQTHVYTLVHTHTHIHTHICTCTNMHTHLSKPPFKSQLKCQETQESLCLGLGQISLL
uniref:Uncharacterized protein n=1 Tax=Myotis myotis TaxID=51298 RepID=A0A7J7Y0F9_MYOMY|nr:hypothetical protein mMyoMyo1_011486 [Myotis myotis]